MRDCNQCGKCCLRYGGSGLSASEEDLNWWENNRPDIFKLVKNKQLWFDPATSAPMATCPWLSKLPNEEKYTCDIYFDRLLDCKLYPSSIDEMIEDACEMIEPADIKDIRQAKKQLDIIMSDSRHS